MTHDNKKDKYSNDLINGEQFIYSCKTDDRGICFAFLIFLETAAPLRIASFTQKITGNEALSMNNQIRKYEATNCSRIAWYIVYVHMIA